MKKNKRCGQFWKLEAYFKLWFFARNDQRRACFEIFAQTRFYNQTSVNLTLFVKNAILVVNILLEVQFFYVKKTPFSALLVRKKGKMRKNQKIPFFKEFTRAW